MQFFYIALGTAERPVKSQYMRQRLGESVSPSPGDTQKQSLRSPDRVGPRRRTRTRRTELLRTRSSKTHCRTSCRNTPPEQKQALRASLENGTQMSISRLACKHLCPHDLPAQCPRVQNFKLMY